MQNSRKNVPKTKSGKRKTRRGVRGEKRTNSKILHLFLLPSKLEEERGLKRSRFYFDDEEKINRKYFPLFSVS